MNKIFYILSFIFLAESLLAQSNAQPKAGPAPKINIAKPTSFQLRNGLKVLVVENHKLPRVSYSLTIDNAPNLEGSKKGVSALTGAMIGGGSEKISKEAFNEEVDFLGASIEFSSDGAFASGLSKYSKRILELMAEGALHTVFTNSELDKEKTKLIESLKATEKSIATVARRVENVLTYGKNHPFGEYVTETSISSISLDDILLHYNTYFVPENAYLVVVGDISSQTIKADIESLFEPWQKAIAPDLSYSHSRDVQYTQINFVDMPNAVQSEISVINLSTLKMKDPDYFAAILANQILGGNYNSYLMSNLREKNAWTYDAGSRIGDSRYISRFIAYTQVRNNVTDSAVVEMMKEIKRIRTEKVSQKDLQNVKASYVGQFVMQIEKPETIAGYALNIKTQGLSGDFYEKYIEKINAVTPEDIMRVVNKYILPEQERIVIVGKGIEVLPALEKLKIPIFYFDKYGSPAEKPNYEIPIPAGVTAQSVLASYINAIGGEQVLRNVKSIFTISSGTIQGAPIELTSKTTVDHNLLREIKVMGMSMRKDVLNQKGGYFIQQGQRKDLSENDLSDLKSSAVPFPELDLIKNSEIKLVGIENYNDTDAYVIQEGDSKFYYDVKTGLKLAERKSMDINGELISHTINYSDYREIKGIKIPHVFSLNIGLDILLTTTDVKINEGVSDADFE